MIDILLACYNGEDYIREQLDSILNQSYQNWNLIIRDDGSSDKTLKVVNEYVERYPEKIQLMNSTFPSGSSKLNFFFLMQEAKQPYVMFCDQDDIWLSNKIEKTLDKMIETEKNNFNLPILIHSDLEVVDEKGDSLASSLYQYQSIDVGYFNRIERLLVQNMVTGCTMMINRPLMKLIKSMPEQAIMHDWWIALHAISFGEIVYIDEPMVRYRQHARNEVGAKDTKSFSYWIKQLSRIKILQVQLHKTYEQAQTFSEIAFEDSQSIAKAYASLTNRSKLMKIIGLIRGGFLKNTWLRRLGQFILC